MVKIVVAGDFGSQGRVAKLIEAGQYEQAFGQVKVLTEQSDLAIVNFECCVADANDSPIEKCGPAIRCSERTIDAIKVMGFDLAALANNHFRDYGQVGVENTLTACKKYGIDYVGGGIDINEAKNIYYKEINGKVFAILNFCESEFSIATTSRGGSAPLDPIDNSYKIKEAKKHANYVLVIVHGGHEGFELPSPRMQSTYRFFVDCGADVVINHHQHCYSGYELYEGAPIFYGIGNFCFDWINKINSDWNEGYMVELKFDNDKLGFEIHPYTQCGKEPTVEMFDDAQRLKFQYRIETINKIISDSEALELEFNKFVKSRKSIEVVFEPYSNRYLSALFSRGFIPSFFNDKKRMLIGNLIRCESHRDVISELLNEERHENRNTHK